MADMEVDTMKKFILNYKRFCQICPRKLLQNCSNLFWKSISRSSVTKTVEITWMLWNETKKIIFKSGFAYIRLTQVENGEL